MKNIVGLTILIIPVFIFAACKKSSSTTTGPADILASGKWQLIGDSSVQTIPGGGGTVVINVFAGLQSCVTDNFYIFNSLSITSTDEGATKCNAADAQTKNTGTWQLLNNNTQLAAQDPVTGQLLTGDIIQLDDNTLKIRYTISTGVTSVNTEVFTHIK